MSAMRRGPAVLVLTFVCADPAADPEREAIRACRVKDHAGFPARARVVPARESTVRRSIDHLAAAETLAGSPDRAVRLLAGRAATGVTLATEEDTSANRSLGRAELAFLLRERDLLTECSAHDRQTPHRTRSPHHVQAGRQLPEKT